MSSMLSREEFENPTRIENPTMGDLYEMVGAMSFTIAALSEALMDADDCLSRRGGHEEWEISELAAKLHDKGWLK